MEANESNNITDNSPIPFETIEKLPLKERRSTYSLKNALRFRAIFDNAIRTNDNTWIACKDCGLSQRTLINRACEALLYLGNELVDSEDKGEFKTRDYLILRSAVTFKLGVKDMGGIEEEGIYIIYKRRYKEGKAINYESIKSNVIKAGGKISPLQTEKKWKDKLIEWVENEDDGVLYIPDLILSMEEQEWVRAILNKAEIEYKVTASEIRAMK